MGLLDKKGVPTPAPSNPAHVSPVQAMYWVHLVSRQIGRQIATKHRLRVKIALGILTTTGFEEAKLGCGFHAFGHNFNLKALGKMNQCTDQAFILPIVSDTSYEAPVDLDFINIEGT